MKRKLRLNIKYVCNLDSFVKCCYKIETKGDAKEREGRKRQTDRRSGVKKCKETGQTD